jgi:hypothetical protein
MTAAFIKWTALGARDARTVTEIDRAIWEKNRTRHAAKMIQRVYRVVRSRRRQGEDDAALMRGELEWGEDAARTRRKNVLVHFRRQQKLYDALAKWRQLRAMPEELRTAAEIAAARAAAHERAAQERAARSEAATWAAALRGQSALHHAVQELRDASARIEGRMLRLGLLGGSSGGAAAAEGGGNAGARARCDA